MAFSTNILTQDLIFMANLVAAPDIKPVSGGSRMLQTGFHTIVLMRTQCQLCSDSLSNIKNKDLCSGRKGFRELCLWSKCYGTT